MTDYSKLRVRDYKYSAVELTTQVVSTFLAKILIAIMPVYIYLAIRQIVMSVVLLTTNRNMLGNLSNDYFNSNKKVKLTMIALATSRTVNILAAYYAFAELDLSLFFSLETPLLILFSLLLSIVLLKEKLTLRFLFNSSLILTGVVLITGFNTAGITALILGLLLVNGLALALTGVLVQSLTDKVTKDSIKALSVISPVIFVVIAALVQLMTQDYKWIYEMNITLITILIVSTLLTLATNLASINAQLAVGAVRYQLVKAFNIVLSIALGVILMGDSINISQFIGIVLAITGVLLVTTNNKRSG